MIKISLQRLSDFDRMAAQTFMQLENYLESESSIPTLGKMLFSTRIMHQAKDKIAENQCVTDRLTGLLFSHKKTTNDNKKTKNQ